MKNKENLLYLFLSLILSVMILSSSQISYDIWWHLMVGKEIVNEFTFPSIEKYSYSSLGVEWCVHSWLSSLVFFLYIVIFDENNLYILPFLCHLIFSTSAFYIVWKYSSNIMLALITLVLSSYMLHSREVRPYIFSELFLMFLYWQIFMAKVKNIKKFLLIVFTILVLWVNMHGEGFGMGILFMLSIMLGNVFKAIVFIARNSFISDPSWINYNNLKTNYHKLAICEIKNIKFDFMKIIFILFAIILNPQPMHLIKRVFNANDYPTIDYLSLFAFAYGPCFYARVTIFFVVVILFIVAFIVILRGKGIQLINSELIFNVMCLSLSFYHSRFFYLLIFPFIYSLINIGRDNELILNVIQKNKNICFAIIFLISVLLNTSKYQPVSFDKYLPIASVKYFMDNGLSGNVFLPPTWSGYLTWKSKGKAKIFSDTRIEPFLDNGVLVKHLTYIADLNNNLDRIIDTGANFIIIPVSHPHATTLTKSSKLKKLFQNENEILFEIK